MDESGLTRTDLDLFLDLAATDPALPDYRRLFIALRQAILTQRIEGGVRLPSTRALATALGIARNTVKGAYELLQAEGYLYTQRGAGSYVADLPVRRREPERSQGPGIDRAAPVSPSTRRGLLQTAVPALDHFPYRRWQRALQSAATPATMVAGERQGEYRLREEVARWLGRQRGMQVTASQVLITSGSQQGLYLIANQLVSQGDPVLLETPGFPGTERAMIAMGGKVVRFHQTQLGAIVGLPAAKLLVVTPSRNFPLGHTLPVERRLALVNWAHANDAWLVEDDYDSEFAAGIAQTAMFALDTRQRVIYTGTFSRTLFPGIRIGYLVLPIPLLEPFLQARETIDGGLSRVPQQALAEFMASGDYSRHLRRMKRLYGQRRAMLEQLLAESTLDQLAVIDAGGGMHLCLQLPDNCDDHRLVEMLNRRGVGVRALRAYEPEGPPGLVLGFAADDRPAMARGVSILAEVVGPAIRQGR